MFALAVWYTSYWLLHVYTLYLWKSILNMFYIICIQKLEKKLEKRLKKKKTCSFSCKTCFILQNMYEYVYNLSLTIFAQQSGKPFVRSSAAIWNPSPAMTVSHLEWKKKSFIFGQIKNYPKIMFFLTANAASFVSKSWFSRIWYMFWF